MSKNTTQDRKKIVAKIKAIVKKLDGKEVLVKSFGCRRQGVSDSFGLRGTLKVDHDKLSAKIDNGNESYVRFEFGTIWGVSEKREDGLPVVFLSRSDSEIPWIEE